jgi:hypothetical protein
MTTLAHVLIEEVEIRVQWGGYWPPFYSAANQEGFPGIHVPDSLIQIVNEMRGITFPIDADLGFWPEIEDYIRFRFRYLTRARGPQTGRVWALLPHGTAAYATTVEHAKWRPGMASANGLAFAVGQNDGSGPQPYVDYYNHDPEHPEAVGEAMFWLCFVLTRST